MKITLIDGEKKDIIFHPFSSSSSVISAEIDEEINKTTILTMDIFDMGVKIEEYKTLVEIEDLKTQCVIFRGRVIKLTENMGTDGIFGRQIQAEDYLSYLNDVFTRPMYFENMSYRDALNNILWQFNTQKKEVINFQVGKVELTGNLTHETKYESCLSVLNNLVSTINAEINYRYDTATNICYIDLLERRGTDKGYTAKIGENMLSLGKENDLSIITRLIPLGKGENDTTLTISSVNNGKDYIDDEEAILKYGIIEGTIENTGIQDATTLLGWGKGKLKELSIPKLSISLDLLDLSLFSDSKIPSLELGDGINVINNVMNINQVIRCIKKTTNLFERHNPKITLASRKKRLSDRLIEVENKTSLANRTFISNAEIRFGDNIDNATPLVENVDIEKQLTSSSIRIKISKYRYTTANGIELKDYPSKISVIVNDVEARYITNITSDYSETINLTNYMKQGRNTIKITCEGYAKIDCIFYSKLYQ